MTTTYTPEQVALIKLKAAAHFFPGEEPKAAQECVIAGRHVRVQYLVTNRKCYDALPTPALQIKVDGKRVAFSSALDLLGA